MTEYESSLLLMIAEAVTRMAEADERRNELLVAEMRMREERWAKEVETTERRWATLTEKEA